MAKLLNIKPLFGWRDVQLVIPSLNSSKLILCPHTGAGFSDIVYQQMSCKINNLRETQDKKRVADKKNRKTKGK